MSPRYRIYSDTYTFRDAVAIAEVVNVLEIPPEQHLCVYQMEDGEVAKYTLNPRFGVSYEVYLEKVRNR